MNDAFKALIATMAECHTRLDKMIDVYLVSIGINPEADDVDLQIEQHKQAQTIFELLHAINPLAEAELP